MRAATPRKKAMRTLYHAGKYLRSELFRDQRWCDMKRARPYTDALTILATAYNIIQGAKDGISRQQSV